MARVVACYFRCRALLVFYAGEQALSITSGLHDQRIRTNNIASPEKKGKATTAPRHVHVRVRVRVLLSSATRSSSFRSRSTLFNGRHTMKPPTGIRTRSLVFRVKPIRLLNFARQ
jgi:hypothetical protein